ncbi:MAG: hypothetical protein ACKO50_14150, partial [Cyanobium sp.]
VAVCQFTPGSRTTLRTLPPTPSALEYTPARSADRHRPEAHWRNPSILSPAVTATGTTFCAAWISGTSSDQAAIVVRSLLAAERSSWLVGVLVGWVVVRLVVRWPVSWDVVVAVDIRMTFSMKRN